MTHNEMAAEQHEIWREMQEMIHEAYEVQETEAAELSGETGGRMRIVTPAVIIRITLAPTRGRTRIFGSPRAVAGAVSPQVQATPVTGRPYVPIQTQSPTTGQTTGTGMVFVPQKGGNVVNMASWPRRGVDPVQQAGYWLRRQIQQSPAIRRRVRRVQVLVDGKPCQHCVRNLAAGVKPLLPTTANMKVRFSPVMKAIRSGLAAAGTSLIRNVRTGRPILSQPIAMQRPIPRRAPDGRFVSTRPGVSIAPSPARRAPLSPAFTVGGGTSSTARSVPFAGTAQRTVASRPVAFAASRPAAVAGARAGTAGMKPQKSVLGQALKEVGL